MKNSKKLQEKLFSILRKRTDIRVFCQYPWSDLEFNEVAHTVKAFLEFNQESLNDDPLIEWLEEYKFFCSELKR